MRILLQSRWRLGCRVRIAGGERMRPNLPIAFSRRKETLLGFAVLGLACGSDPAPSADPATSASAALSDASQWVTHRDAKGAFQMKFPEAPLLEQNDPPRKSPEEMALSVTNAKYADDLRLLVATKVELSDVGRYDCQTGMAGMWKSSLAGMGCQAIDDQPHELRGLPGREVLFSCTKRPTRGVMWLGCDASALSSRRVTAFSLLAVYQNTAWNSQEARAFLDSFELLGK
jgi:hypothetical protein